MYIKFDYFLELEILQLFVIIRLTNEAFTTGKANNGKLNKIYGNSLAYTEGEIS